MCCAPTVVQDEVFKENINCSTNCTIQQPNVEPTLLWQFKALEYLDSKRIKLFLPLCLPHFYGDQNKDRKEESEA